MLEIYLKMKESYPKSIVLIKAGSFFECLNDDAKVLNICLGRVQQEIDAYVEWRQSTKK